MLSIYIFIRVISLSKICLTLCVCKKSERDSHYWTLEEIPQKHQTFKNTYIKIQNYVKYHKISLILLSFITNIPGVHFRFRVKKRVFLVLE